jgi:hypothetical protein
MKIQVFIAVMALLNAGCAVQTISGQVGRSDLDMFTVNAGEPKFMDAVAIGQRIPGTDGIGFLPHVSAGAFIAGGVVGGIATGSAQTGIAIQQAINSSGALPNSTDKVRASDIYAESIGGLTKSSSQVALEPPKNGIFATPFIALSEIDTGQLFHSCAVSFSGYAASTKKWTLVASHSSELLPRSVLQNLAGSEFQQQSRSCFRLVSETFIQYANGKYDGNFKGGQLTLNNGAIRGGTFARDDELGMVMQMMVSAYPQGMIVMRSTEFKSLSFD